MTALRDLIGDRDPVLDDWPILADAWGVASDYTLRDVAPASVSCRLCWDWGLCAECVGVHSDTCAGDCAGGACPECGKLAAPAERARALSILISFHAPAWGSSWRGFRSPGGA